MDKFEIEQFGLIRDVVADLQTCFIDGDAYSRTPSAREWRRGSALVHRLTLLCFELHGYASATRQYHVADIRERLHIEGGEKQKETEIVETDFNRGFIIFSEKEILSMPKNKRNYFRIDGKKVPYRRKSNGTYELRKTINGVLYYGASTNLKQAKAKFIEDIKRRGADENPAKVSSTIAPITRDVPDFCEYSFHYLDVFKKPNICKKAFENYERVIKKHFYPYFSGKKLEDVTATDCQTLLTSLRNAGKNRTAETVNGLLNWIINAAITDGYITRNPMETVKIPKHYRQAGKCIPRELMATLLTAPKCRYDYIIWLSAYTGIRPCEIKGITIEGDFFKVQNRKTDPNAPPTFRTIPIHSELQPYLDFIDFNADEREAARHFRRRIKGYRFYDLRHTFTTVIQECGANKEWVDYVTNHTAAQNTTARVYTHWNDDFHRKQMAFLKF